MCICFISLSVCLTQAGLDFRSSASAFWVLGSQVCAMNNPRETKKKNKTKTLIRIYLQNNTFKWHIPLILIVISFGKQNTYMNEQVVSCIPCIFCSYLKVYGRVPRGSSCECESYLLLFFHFNLSLGFTCFLVLSFFLCWFFCLGMFSLIFIVILNNWGLLVLGDRVLLCLKQPQECLD